MLSLKEHLSIYTLPQAMLFAYDDAVQFSHALGSLKINHRRRFLSIRNALVCRD